MHAACKSLPRFGLPPGTADHSLPSLCSALAGTRSLAGEEPARRAVAAAAPVIGSCLSVWTLPYGWAAHPTRTCQLLAAACGHPHARPMWLWKSHPPPFLLNMASSCPDMSEAGRALWRSEMSGISDSSEESGESVQQVAGQASG